MAAILLIDDDSRIRAFLRTVVESEGHTVLETDSGPAGVAMYEAHRPDVVLCDVVLPGFDGIVTLDRIKTINPDAVVVMVTGESSTQRAIKAMALGANDYLVKPLKPSRLLRVLRQIVESLGQLRPSDTPGSSSPEAPSLIGDSDVMYEVFKLIGRVAPQPTTVLILGESGTGKELVARAIHSHSRCKDGPFVAINCAAIPESLLESELFGHEKGAFTGADRRRPGKFELARGGTLFLDEIGEMCPAVQAKLLRVLEDQEFYRLGGAEPIRTDARIVAATNRDLRNTASSGRFREDLFYRLGGVIIPLPPLRERRDDIRLLAEHFLRKAAQTFQRHVVGFAPAALDLLNAYHWPGNVREMANVIHQAVLQAPGPTIVPAQFAALVPANRPSPSENRGSIFDPDKLRAHVTERIEQNDREILAPLLAACERAVIQTVLEHCQGNASQAAKYLGIHRTTLKARLAGSSSSETRDTGDVSVETSIS